MQAEFRVAGKNSPYSQISHRRLTEKIVTQFYFGMSSLAAINVSLSWSNDITVLYTINSLFTDILKEYCKQCVTA